MPKVSEMRESKFLKKEDVGRGAMGTIHSCVQMNVAMEGAGQELKWCLTFTDIEKPLVLNSTNIQLCQNICGSDDTDHWVGKRVVLYNDPNVSYQGKLIGGIRMRAPKPTAPPPPPVAAAVMATGDIDDADIPFAWLMPLIVPALGLIGAVLA